MEWLRNLSDAGGDEHEDGDDGDDDGGDDDDDDNTTFSNCTSASTCHQANAAGCPGAVPSTQITPPTSVFSRSMFAALAITSLPAAHHSSPPTPALPHNSTFASLSRTSLRLNQTSQSPDISTPQYLLSSLMHPPPLTHTHSP